MKFLLGYNMKIVILWKGINLWSREHKFGEGESTGRIPGEGGWTNFWLGVVGALPHPPSKKNSGHLQQPCTLLRLYPLPLLKRRGISPVKHKHKHVLSVYCGVF